MSRPQLLIIYEKTIRREYQEKLEEQKAMWQHTANILAAIYNTAMGSKGKQNPKKFMPDFEDDPFKTHDTTKDLINKAEKLGLKTPSKKKL